MKKFYFLSAAIAAVLLFSANVRAEDYVITVKDHQFLPQKLIIPAEQKVKVIVKNLDPTIIEFESFELSREKIIGGNSQAIIFIGPVKAGEYGYFDDFRSKTSKGTIIAK